MKAARGVLGGKGGGGGRGQWGAVGRGASVGGGRGRGPRGGGARHVRVRGGGWEGSVERARYSRLEPGPEATTTIPGVHARLCGQVGSTHRPPSCTHAHAGGPHIRRGGRVGGRPRVASRPRLLLLGRADMHPIAARAPVGPNASLRHHKAGPRDRQACVAGLLRLTGMRCTACKQKCMYRRRTHDWWARAPRAQSHIPVGRTRFPRCTCRRNS